VCLTRPASGHIELAVTNTLQNQKIETSPVVVLSWVDERNFYGYTSTINGTEEEKKLLKKISLSLETVCDYLKVLTLL